MWIWWEDSWAVFLHIKSYSAAVRCDSVTQHAVNSTHVSSWPRVELTLVKSTRGQLDSSRLVWKSKLQLKREERYINCRLEIYGHAVQSKHDEL